MAARTNYFDEAAKEGTDDEGDYDEETGEAVTKPRKPRNGVDDSSEEDEDEDDEEAAREARLGDCNAQHIH